jgi:hypothetical protein
VADFKNLGQAPSSLWGACTVLYQRYEYERSRSRVQFMSKESPLCKSFNVGRSIGLACDWLVHQVV